MSSFALYAVLSKNINVVYYNFVSPSKMEAASYSGDETVYMADVDISDVAWIDETQGQLATDKSINYKKISCKGLI